MQKLSFHAFFLLLCVSFFVCQTLSRPISLKAASDSSDAAVADEISSLKTAGNGEDWWFHGGFPKSWPFAHPPLPADFPKSKWPFVHPPMPAGGLKWPHWPFVHPTKKWPFVHPPLPDWPFAKPPFPCPWWPSKGHENVKIIGTEGNDEAAAPPLAA